MTTRPILLRATTNDEWPPPIPGYVRVQLTGHTTTWVPAEAVVELPDLAPGDRVMVPAAVEHVASDAWVVVRSDVQHAGWQPIETAPFTSRAILVWCPERHNTYVVTWWGGSSSEEMPCWRHFGGHSDLHEEPSHWMPLPKPPETQP